MPAGKFTNKTLSHILSVFYFHFLRIHHTSSEEGLKVCECNFFQRKGVLRRNDRRFRRKITTKSIRHETIFNFHMNNSDTIIENICYQKNRVILLKC